MTSDFITIKNLSKRFPDSGITALDDISCTIARGKITGLIGPDGAGKTTLIRTIIGLLLPSKGTIDVNGLNPLTDKEELNLSLGYMPQKFGLYEDLSISENLKLYAELKAIPPQDQTNIFNRLLKFTNLQNFTTRLAGELSGGMKQKLGLACALLSAPKLLLLDEPSVGVDPISRRELIKMVNELAEGGTTILWSTAYLDEAENFDDCLLLNEGKILYQGKPEALTQKLQNRVALLQNTSGSNRDLLKRISGKEQNIVDAVIQGTAVRVVFKDKIRQMEGTISQIAAPRFEDAVIDVLGGIPHGVSPLNRSYPQTAANVEYPVDAQNLVKTYGSFYAVKNNTFQIRRGEIFGLLGPNGAGKSTSFKMLCGLTTPTSGTARIMGVDVRKKPALARSRLGYMAQKFSLYADLNVLQNLNFFSGIYGLKGTEQKEKIAEMTDMFHLGKHLKTNAGDLPLGYKQRLALSCAIMHNPAVLFLDEPTSGVDPLTRREFWNHINVLAGKGVTIMVTTHFMDEAEYCDRISLFYQGQAIATGSPDELKHSVSAAATMEDAFISLIENFDAKATA